ncbi:alanine--tRNA ligase [Candidatus Gottesmanbacteria bacterium]|nr:alanine--tRNA ligase [Candidatus Gottesmanbacteria bacterium]
MKSSEVRKKYLSFFASRGHVIIPSSPLVPENDPTTLFTSSGMQPLIPYLLGALHPAGKRLVNSQKSFRAQDIYEVGDNRHTTFFEMLGNWSLGDYFKKEQLPWIFEFLTKDLKLDPKKLYVTVFTGEAGSGSARTGQSLIPKDIESIQLWKEIFSRVGIDAKIGDHASSADARIYTYNARKNWWSRSGEPDKMPAGEPGGPDSEVFYDFGPSTSSGQVWHDSKFGEKCHPNCDCGRFMEIANSVFMQYQKQADGSLKELAQKNVDFGGGLERLVSVTNNSPDVFTSDLFTGAIATLEQMTHKHYAADETDTRSMRILADHIRGAVMMMADGVIPSNKAQGYILRRLIRRSLLYGRRLGITEDWKYIGELVAPFAKIYEDSYPDVLIKTQQIKLLLEEEGMRFGKTLEKGLSEIEKIETLDGHKAFYLYESFGFPWEMTEEIARDRGQNIKRTQFEEEFMKHKDASRTAAAGMFKGGLADHGEETTKLHTATHLLHEALRRVLGEHIAQKGSNITAERLRFDFSHPTKVSSEEIQKIEAMVNEKISENLPVFSTTMKKEEALASGARAFFSERYGITVTVYSVGEKGREFSREICGGPHVAFTGLLGRFTIVKEESLGAGIRRVYATVTKNESAAHPGKISSKA